MLALPTFVSTFLQAARSPELHSPATLDSLCRIALDAHYKSALPPLGSIIRHGELPVAIVSTIQDVLALLRTAHSLTMSHFHQLTTSASELTMLLLSCAPDLSLIPAPQAMVIFAHATDVLQNSRLNPELRPALENFTLSLTLIIGDDAKAVREAQLMHSIQMAFQKTDSIGNGSSEVDIISMGLLVHHLVGLKIPCHAFPEFVLYRCCTEDTTLDREPVTILLRCSLHCTVGVLGPR